MGKLIQIPVWGIILALCSFIASVVSYAYSNDNGTQDEKIKTNQDKIVVIEKDLGIYAKKTYVVEKIEEHKQVQAAEMENVNTKLTNMEKTANETKQMVGKLLDIQLKKGS